MSAGPRSFCTSICVLGSVAVTTLTGCSVSPSGEAADAEVASPATAVVVVEGSTTNEGTRSEAVARFVRARGGAVDDDALRMVGATVDFPAMGSCGSLAPPRPTTAFPRTLALLNVGGVTLLAGGTLRALQPRQLPDVADLVSGVVYSARGEGLPSKSAYALRIEGAPELDVAPFVVSATSPGEPTALRIGGEDGRSGVVTIPAAAAVELTWDAGSADDVVYVDVSATSAAPTMRCLFDDAGHASLPASAFGAVEDGTLSVHRLHREAFRARGIDPGEVRFDFARVVPFARR